MSATVPLSGRIPARERPVPSRGVLLAVSFGAFLTSFDAGATTALLPSIGHAFARGIADVQWVLAADLLVASALLLVFGGLADRFGPRRVYLAGFVVFLCGCILCGTAQSLMALIAFRAFTGAGAAMLLAGSPAVLATHVPAASRGSGFGVKASCLYLGLVAGPLAAGWIAGRLGWRAVFVIQVPAALMGLLLAAISIPRGALVRRKSYDLTGPSLCSLGLASGLWLAGHRTAPAWNWLFPAGLLLLGVWIAARRRGPEAVCFRSGAFSASVLSLAMAFAASYMLTFALPFLVVQVRNEGPAAAGRALAAYAIARSLVAWYSGRWSDRLDNRLLAVPGLVVFLCGVVALSRMDTGSPLSALMAGVSAAGLGFGCFVPPNNNTLMQLVPRELYGFAAGMMATSRTLGMAVGVALDGALLPVAGGTLASRAALALRVAAMLAAAAAIIAYRANAGPQRTTARQRFRKPRSRLG